MIQLVIAAVLIMGCLGLVLGLVIGFFAKVFKVETDPRIELVTELLPGANCGGCGKAGCSDFAKSVVNGENPPGKCPVSSKEQITAIAMALGVDPGSAFPRRAVVRCGGDIHQVNRKINYNGVLDCASANLISGGPKGCRYGCIGMGSCAAKCPFGAIEIINNLAVVHEELCVGCGTCAAVCPRGVIELVPMNSRVHVYCNSPEKGPEKRKNCKVSCLGCRKCERLAPEKFKVEGFLARVDYEADPPPTEEDVEKVGCPTGALLTASRHYEIETFDPEFSIK
ncbi:MAG: RnfABCDGE type electron transport complex subunit B [Lentisphaeria bacterium]|nr:RnfABCDGE type electron transport complex subunit B [Lentisphaeria bacterium]